MARNGVPLAVAQKIMRHSSPVLTSNYYTHILVADKAREMAKLPTIKPEPEKQEAVKTGTNDRDDIAVGTIVMKITDNEKIGQNRNGADGRIVVSVIDRFCVDSMANKKTYKDNWGTENSVVYEVSKTQKAPVSQGILAEREGFEPSVQVIPYVGLASRDRKSTRLNSSH